MLGMYMKEPTSGVSGLVDGVSDRLDGEPVARIKDHWFMADALVDANEFEPGDIVELVVGGPDMVVLSTCECGQVEVVWTEDGRVIHAVFPEEALIDV